MGDRKITPDGKIDTVAEFQARRAEVWRRVRTWFVIIVASFAFLIFYCRDVLPEPTLHFWLCFPAFLLVIAGIAYCTFVWKRFYRCPKCEVPIMQTSGARRSVPLDPDVCENCGARLR